MAKAVRIHEFGDSSVMKLEEVEVGDPGPGDVRVQQPAMSVHFADILVRQGKYFLKPELPATIGLEAIGTVTAVGDDVTNVKEGDRVAYTFSLGSYATERLVPAAPLIKVPDGLDDHQVLGALLRGMTAQYLVRQIHQVTDKDTVLVQAAAGGVGQLLVQWAKHLGATVIATAGSPEKCKIAAGLGADHTIDYTKEDFAEKALEFTDGDGVDVVYDNVGKDTYEGNIKALKTRGFFINYGHSSGFLPPMDAMQLNQKSLVFTKASLKDFANSPQVIKAMSDDVFEMLKSGAMKVDVTTYPMADVAKAHDDMENRRTTGSLVLVAD